MRLSLLTAAALAAPAALTAQVGYDPGHSPYRDIPKGHTISASFGRFGGTGGSLRLGPHAGNVYGVRYDLRTNSFLQFGIDISHGTLERFIVDPFVPKAQRVRGPIPQSITFAEAALQLNLTGGKTWHRLAPFFGVGLGIGLGNAAVAGDTSGYTFKNKFYFAPTIGTRLFLTDRLQLRAEVRSLFWKLTYPTRFLADPPSEPGTPAGSNAVIAAGRLNEWTPSLWLRVALAYSIRF